MFAQGLIAERGGWWGRAGVTSLLCADNPKPGPEPLEVPLFSWPPPKLKQSTSEWRDVIVFQVIQPIGEHDCSYRAAFEKSQSHALPTKDLRRRLTPHTHAGADTSCTRHFAPPQGCLRSGRGCVAMMAQAAEQLVALELYCSFLSSQQAEGRRKEGRGR